MCLVVLALGQSARHPLILAGNRDEFHARPSQAARWWPDRPDICGGRDLQAGGTWLALHRSGRFATVTNYRDAEPVTPGRRSRGHLVTGFLEGEDAPLDYVASIDGSAYSGFNLIVGDAGRVAYVSNRGGAARELPPGIYGLSNALLDGPWHKIDRGRQGLEELIRNDTINESSLLRLLADRSKAPVAEVEPGHLEFTRAHAITAPFIVTPEYGTRCTTVVLADDSGQWRMVERRFDKAGEACGESRISFAAGTQS